MNDEKQVDRDHAKPVKKVKFCPLLERNVKDMTYGKVYDVVQIHKTGALNGEKYQIQNDAGENVWMKQEHFDELPLKGFDNEFIKDQLKRDALEELWKPETCEELAKKIEPLRDKPVEDLAESLVEELKSLSGLDEDTTQDEPFKSCHNSSCPEDRKIFADPKQEIFGLDNIDVILANVAKVFPSNDPTYPSINPEDIMGLLHKKMGYEFSIEGDFLAVSGMTTKFTKDSIDTAHRGLKCIVGPAKATKMVARAIQSQLEKIF